MSFRPVLGRSSAVAFVWTTSLYSWSMSILMTALPSFRSTPPMSPMRTPATRTVWPCPATTACAVENSALSWYGLGSKNGIRRRCWSRMYSDTPAAMTISPMIAAKFPRFFLIAVTCRSPSRAS